MEHMSLFPGNCEIVEIEEDDLHLQPAEHPKPARLSKSQMKMEDKDHRALASNLGRISTLEDDLNQLFEIFNRRASSHGLGHLNHAGVHTLRKTSSKKPVGARESSHSPKIGISERVSLKQALRGLCISQASEMAAMKRSARSGGRSSEAGSMMTMYHNVAIEDTISVLSQDEVKGGMLEISLVPEDISVKLLHKMSDTVPVNQSVLSDRGEGPTSIRKEKILELDEGRSQTLKPEMFLDEYPATLPSSSCPSPGNTTPKLCKDPLVQNGLIFTTSEVGNGAALTAMLKKEDYAPLPASSSSTAGHLQKIVKGSANRNAKLSMSAELASQTSSTELSQKQRLASVSSPSFANNDNNTLEMGKMIQKEVISASSKGGSQTLGMNVLHKEEHPPLPSYHSDHSDSFWELSKTSPARKASAAKSSEVDKKGSAVKPGQKDSSEIMPSTSSIRGNKVGKPTRNVSYIVKSVIKTKSFVKKKSKEDLTSVSSSYNTHPEVNDDMALVPNPIVCPRCHCVVTDAQKEPNLDSPVSPFTSLSAKVSSGNVVSDAGSPCLTSDGFKKSKAVEVASNSKSREKSEFTQSSKSSPDECSSSTSISEDSNLSRPSFCDRPHMSKDVRWEAIRCFRMQHGTIGLRHFNLLKKLGCGDIGTVYLAELIGTNCLFAIKVMDNDFLVRRKKICRAQTEKQILRMLDHPFLPTLYCQFTSDNLSCLVMEYCPGGDLHVLRQRQPGRCFPEQAARFYVAEVLLALEYLHMLGVVYRDLKPENILVREDGHIMLSDFDLSLRCAVNPMLLVSSSILDTTERISGPCVDSGCARSFCIEPSCQVTCFSPRLLVTSRKPQKLKSERMDRVRPLPLLVAEPTTARSDSFVGTHEYLAPEIIKGEGHGSSVDWWTFGIFLYELLYGRTPFKGSGNEETLANVVLQTLKFPDSPLVSFEARDLIAALLIKEPENRLGSERGAAEIKQHPFFEGLNWALIRCAVPPELPESRNFGFIEGPFHEKGNNYLEYDANTGEHLEFEVF
ncbi:hypothetical protein Ancab_014338 [Ancistrocladus abbreviatus]